MSPPSSLASGAFAIGQLQEGESLTFEVEITLDSLNSTVSHTAIVGQPVWTSVVFDVFDGTLCEAEFELALLMFPQ